MNSARIPAPLLSAACALLLALLLVPSLAQAHRVTIFAWVEGSMIHTESQFAAGRPVKGGTVQILDAATGDELASAPTDDQGVCVLPIPEAAIAGQLDLTLVIIAGEGHRGEWPMKASEYMAAVGEPVQEAAPAPQDAPEAVPDTPAPGTPESSASPGAAPAPCQANLEAMVDAVVARHVDPLRRELAALSDQGPGVSEIVGGIGWIIGLAGMFLYFRSRKS